MRILRLRRGTRRVGVDLELGNDLGGFGTVRGQGQQFAADRFGQLRDLLGALERIGELRLRGPDPGAFLKILHDINALEND